jgi:hypothetical protein
MKVMCIDDQGMTGTDNYPKFGEIVTVARQCELCEDAWDISEYLFTHSGCPQSFLKRRFAPTSQIDETELVEQRLITA